MTEERQHLRTNYSWIYAVIIVLGLKEAISLALPFVFPQSGPVSSQTFLAARDFGIVPSFMIFRLMVFVVVSIRFYLGSALFFETVYYGADSERMYFRKNHSMDFLFGFVQFLLFLVLAQCIDPMKYPIRTFPFVLGSILVYDSLWFLSSMRLDTVRLIKFSVIVNLFTLFFAMNLYWAVLRLTNSHVMAEEVALSIVLLVSLIDLGQMVARTNLLRIWLQRSYDRDLR